MVWLVEIDRIDFPSSFTLCECRQHMPGKQRPFLVYRCQPHGRRQCYLADEDKHML
jgi:hypothetical protein